MKHLLKPAFFCLTTVFLATSAVALEIPKLNGQVNDNANLLSSSAEKSLSEALSVLEQKTSVQVVLLTVPNTQGVGIETFSVETAQKWGLGQKGKDNGLLITYAVEEDLYRIEVGYGLEGAIPDGRAGDIIRQKLRAHANPKANTRDFDTAFKAAVGEISDIVYSEYEKDPTGESMKGVNSNSFALFIVAVMSFALFTAIASVIHPAAGAVMGAISGLVLAYILSLALIGHLAFLIIGAVLGAFAAPILEGLPEGGGGSYGYGGGSGGGSGGFGGGYSGGGGGFGGGGASG